VSGTGNGRLQVFLLDDDESLRRALARTIRLAGFAVQTFDSAEALLAAAMPRNACLVLDIRLPGLDGIRLKRVLDAAGCGLRTVFITALEPAEVEEPLATLGPVTVLHKPFSNEVLLDAIRQVIRQCDSQGRRHPS
jgi:FixJ family two-component response regulator